MTAAAICTWIKNKKILVWIAGIAAALLLLYTSADGVYDSRHMLSRRNWSKDTMVQYVFAEEINKTENPTLLNCGALDGGFYLAADIIPTERWFCKLNVGHQECYEAQYSAIKEGRVDYVVTRHKTLEELNMDPELYDMIMEYKKFYLYRLKNLAK